MNDKLELCSLQICAFKIINEGSKKYKPLREEYPYRLCILDSRNPENKKAIDIDTGLSYDYLEMSTVYFYGVEAKKIKENERYAILKLPVMDVTNDILVQANYIRKLLKNNFPFQKGTVLSNEEYLNMINNDKLGEKTKVLNKN